MENQAVDAAMMAGSVGADQFTMISMFLRADVVVKSVMVILVLASIWCWAIIIDKVRRLRRLRPRPTRSRTASGPAARSTISTRRSASAPRTR